MTTQKCSYCGQSLSSAAFKCTRCKKWVDNEVFNRLSDDDVKLIKNNNLLVATPTLLAFMVISILKESDSLEENISKREKKALKRIERFALLVFRSFCYFWTIRIVVKKKKGCRDAIIELLKIALLQGVVELFGAKVEHSASAETLQEYGRILYAKLQEVLSGLGTSASSQAIASNAFRIILFGDERSNWLTGLRLYAHFMATFEHMREVFQKMFVVEEEDFDWRAMASTERLDIDING